MFINFNKIIIEGFQSIGISELELSQRGVILVKGYNEYEEFTESNGSGKSSIFEAILWCIYGKTSSGVSNVKNKYYNNGCSVELNIEINNTAYTIIRSIDHVINKTSLKLYRENKDISGRNKTDTNKLILSIFNDISIDLFMSVIFLSQGFQSRISNLSPSAKKDRIEKLSNNSINIENFKTKFSELKYKYSSDNDNLLKDIGSIEGKKSYIESDIMKLKDSLSHNLNLREEEIPDLNLLKENYKVFNDTINNLRNKLSELKSEYNNITHNINIFNNEIRNLNIEINQDKDRLNCVKDNNVCYVCKQSLNNELSESLKNDILDKLKSRDEDLNKLQESLRTEEIKRDDIYSNKEIIENKINSMEKTISDIKNSIDKYSNLEDIDELKSKISDKNAEFNNLDNELKKYNKDLDIIKDKLGIIDNCVYMITRQFRLYLLNNIIVYMNKRLEYYSDKLYNHKEDTISISDNFDILLGDFDYNSLSGGEKRKVDIALVFAQRDLSLNLSGLSSNLIILDEIYDNLDDKAISVVSDLISNISNIDSMFVISHMKNVDIKYDSIIKVIKNKDRISNIIE